MRSTGSKCTYMSVHNFRASHVQNFCSCLSCPCLGHDARLGGSKAAGAAAPTPPAARHPRGAVCQPYPPTPRPAGHGAAPASNAVVLGVFESLSGLKREPAALITFTEPRPSGRR
eukprot:SAG22_NODE_1568_length_4098_cov_21.457614_3_plen_115_part_00